VQRINISNFQEKWTSTMLWTETGDTEMFKGFDRPDGSLQSQH
jgi:hypothetical protein